MLLGLVIVGVVGASAIAYFVGRTHQTEPPSGNDSGDTVVTHVHTSGTIRSTAHGTAHVTIRRRLPDGTIETTQETREIPPRKTPPVAVPERDVELPATTPAN